MWANTVPDGGLLVIGMEDHGKIHWMPQFELTIELNLREKVTLYTYCPDARESTVSE